MEEALLSGEVRGGPVAAAREGAPPPMPPRADASALLRQVAEALPRLAEGRLEVALAPEELGRLRFQIASGENGLVVQVTAERAETLELMRRHAGQLARDFAEAGFGGASFHFGEQGARGGQRPAPEPALAPRAPPAEPGTAASAPLPQRPAAGLDIRI
jgi:flagellar hook-length control protein FliK